MEIILTTAALLSIIICLSIIVVKSNRKIADLEKKLSDAFWDKQSSISLLQKGLKDISDLEKSLDARKAYSRNKNMLIDFQNFLIIDGQIDIDESEAQSNAQVFLNNQPTP